MNLGRLLTWVMIVTFVFANCSAAVAAVCSHMDARDHAIALQSDDSRISASAQTEEAAGSVAAKKGAPVDAGSVQLAAYTLSASTISLPIRAQEPNRMRATNAARPTSASVQPLLEPPAA